MHYNKGMSEHNLVIDGMKVCHECNKNKPVTEYYLTSNGFTFKSDCKQCLIKETTLKMRQKYSYQWWYSKYRVTRRTARLKNRAFELTLDDYKKLKIRPCYYCDKLEKDAMTIDRVDNSKGYHISNCVSCCRSCNAKKRTLTVDMCKKVVEFLRV